MSAKNNIAGAGLIAALTVSGVANFSELDDLDAVSGNTVATSTPIAVAPKVIIKEVIKEVEVFKPYPIDAPIVQAPVYVEPVIKGKRKIALDGYKPKFTRSIVISKDIERWNRQIVELGGITQELCPPFKASDKLAVIELCFYRVATSLNEAMAQAKSSQAKILDLSKRTQRIDNKGYVRRLDKHFGVLK